MEQYRKSPRWRTYDYRSAGIYFITIVTKERQHFFGEIRNDCLYPSEVGSFALASWENAALLRPDMNIQLDKSILMPNHFHAILVIGNNQFNNCFTGSGQESCIADNAILDIEPVNKFDPQSKNLGAVVRGFKGTVTSYARQHDITFEWQSRYHDHVIRNYIS